jgi:hypothetical protein
MSLSAQEADLFEDSRGRLEAIADRLLGSAGDAEDAVQDAFLRCHAADGERIETLEAWLAADDHAARLTGRKVPETTIGYTVQRVTPDDRAMSAVVKGRTGARIKDLVCARAAWTVC